MIKSKIYRKYFVLAATILFIFLVLGFYANRLVFDYIRDQSLQNLKRDEPVPPVFMARILDRINPKDKLAGLIELESWHNNKHRPGLVLFLFDEAGQILYPQNNKSPLPKISKWPTQTYSYIQIPLSAQMHQPPPPGPPPMGFPGSPPPLFPKDAGNLSLIKLDGTPIRYLGVLPRFDFQPPMTRFGAKPEKWIFWISPLSMLLSLLLGVGVALAFIYNSVQKQIEVADQVIDSLRHGNLKARFPIIRKDEFGHVMSRFNLMADEIEKLVVHLKDVEQARNKLLQELAHDLRTPLTSLRSMLETLITRDKDLAVELKMDLLKSSASEIAYFSRLVDDLLFMSQISDPHYSLKLGKINIYDLINQITEPYKFKYPQIKLGLEVSDKSLEINADQKLVERLLRNALDNGYSFAKEKVEVLIRYQQDKLWLTINDDGPGFSNEAIESFGIKKASRVLDSKASGRISVGLGSVIMRSIAEVHQGQLKVSNRYQGKLVIGSSIDIMLPLS